MTSPVPVLQDLDLVPSNERVVQVPDLKDLKLISVREAEILAMVANGHSAKEIADKMMLSQRTIDQHVNHLKMKLRARNRAHLITIGLREGLLIL